jgi:hypothetical protein
MLEFCVDYYHSKNCDTRFEIVTRVKVMISVYWDVTPYTSVERYQLLGGTLCLRHRGIYSEDGTQHFAPQRWYLSTKLHGVTSSL